MPRQRVPDYCEAPVFDLLVALAAMVVGAALAWVGWAARDSR